MHCLAALLVKPCNRCGCRLLQGYQLGSSQLDFAITIQVTSTTSASSAATVTETLQLDPSDPYVLDNANLVSAQLLGDLLTYTALPVFTDTYLMIPSPTGTLKTAECIHDYSSCKAPALMLKTGIGKGQHVKSMDRPEALGRVVTTSKSAVLVRPGQSTSISIMQRFRI